MPVTQLSLLVIVDSSWHPDNRHPVHIVVDTQLDLAGIAQNLIYAQNYTSRKYCATDKNLLLSRNSMLTQIQQMSKRIVCCEKISIHKL